MTDIEELQLVRDCYVASLAKLDGAIRYGEARDGGPFEDKTDEQKLWLQKRIAATNRLIDCAETGLGKG